MDLPENYTLVDTLTDLCEERMDRALLLETPCARLAVYSSASPVEDKANEDCICIVPVDAERIVLIIADGAGGHIHGQEASSIVTRNISKLVSACTKNSENVREAILNGIDQANRMIISDVSGAASTVAVLEVNGNEIRSYHVGDTEILVTGQRGKIKHNTLNHAPVAYAVEAGFLEESQAVMHEERHMVSNILGFDDFHMSMSTEIVLSSYDTVLMASDGLFDNLQKQEIIEIVRKRSLRACSNLLIESVRNRMLGHAGKEQPCKPDDTSFIIFRSKGS